MFFLKKIFQLRDKANPHAEKPFLEHLEDLRICITRVVLTLLIATITCFVFRNELMAIIRRPVEQVWKQGEEKSLEVSKISLEAWETAKSIQDALAPLPEPDREAFLQRKADELEVDPETLHEDILAVRYYRAALLFEDMKDRVASIENLEGIDNALRSKVLALIEGNPNPQADARGKMVLMQALTPTEGFMLSIKLAFFAGIVVAFPFLLFFILQFVVPGMHDAERKALWPAMTVGFGLFLGGVFFSYFVVLEKVLEFFHNYSAGMMIENEWRIGYYISFATQFTLIFGLSFELPVVVMTLVHLGLLNSEMMRNTRAYAILAIFVVAAIITPTPDALTLCLLAGPMVILYEICIWLAYFLDKKKARKEAEEEKERLTRLLALEERRAELGEPAEDTPDEGHPDDPYHDHPDHVHDHEPDDDHRSGHGHDPDFHEEVDPALTETEEGEQEDISDPWPDEDDEETTDEKREPGEGEPSGPDQPDEEPTDDIPDEERHRDRGDPDKKDQD